MDGTTEDAGKEGLQEIEKWNKVRKMCNERAWDDYKESKKLVCKNIKRGKKLWENIIDKRRNEPKLF